MTSSTFGKSRRLRRRSEFQRVFSAGRRAQGRYLTMLAAANESGEDRLGIVASRKLGDAVRRNLAKRLIREIFRQGKSSSPRPGADLVVIPRRELFDASYSSLESDYRAALRRCTAGLAGRARD